MLIPTPGAPHDLESLILTGISTGFIGKILLTAIRTMPPPPSTCNFPCRWFYDFIQSFGDNQDKIGQSRPLTSTSTINVEQSKVTTEHSTASVEKPDPNGPPKETKQ